MRISDWSSDVCSSDLPRRQRGQRGEAVDDGQADARANERGRDIECARRHRMVELEPEPALFLDEYLADRSARRDADEAMFAEVPEREARRGFGHVGFAIEDDQLALAEPAAADRGVLRP